MDRRRTIDKIWIHEFHVFDDEYTQGQEDTVPRILVICGTQAQAMQWAKAKPILQFDLAFKMVQGDINLFSISGYDEHDKRKLLICTTYV